MSQRTLIIENVISNYNEEMDESFKFIKNKSKNIISYNIY